MQAGIVGYCSISNHESFGWLNRFAAALISQPVWVMNIMPTSEPDTLPIIFDRGLIGMYHDWCEPHSTYPRSYDLLHANHLLSSIDKK